MLSRFTSTVGLNLGLIITQFQIVLLGGFLTVVMFISPRIIQSGRRVSSLPSRGEPLRAVFFLLLIGFALALSGCKSDYPSSARQTRPGGDKREARQVKITQVVEMPLGQAVTVNGSLAAYDQATIGTKVPGRLQQITVDIGSPVRQGQLVARIEPQDYQLRVQQAEAALAQARARVGLPPEGTTDKVDPEQTSTVREARAVYEEAKLNHQRSATLVGQGVISRAEFDSANAALKVAESRYQDAIEEVRNRLAIISQRRSEVALARQQLQDTAAYAPFDGIVEEKRASVGEYVAAGAPVVKIVKMSPLRFRAEVSERDAANVRIGQVLRLTVEGSPSNYAGRVMRLSPTISQQSRVLIIEADVTNDGNLRPGSFARAEIATDDSSMGVTVPTNSIVTFAGIEKVIVVENGKAVEKQITTGRRAGEWTEVIAGVKVGEMVVVEPGNLQSGQPVAVTQ